MAGCAVCVEGLGFAYRRGHRALRSVSVELGTGVVALLGPNGAGKSTLMSLIATVLRLQSGRIEVEGHDVAIRGGRAQARRVLGFLPQRFDLVPSMTLLNTVAYAGWVSGLEKHECAKAAARALAVVELGDRAHDRVRSLSGGQRQRLGIAAAIAHDPKVLLLDEPTVGLDPTQRIRIRQYLEALGQDRTVLLSTHMIEDVARLCAKVLVLDEGEVVFDGTTAALAARGPQTKSGLVSPLEVAYQSLLVNEAWSP